MAYLLLVLLYTLFTQHVSSQTTTRLPPPPEYNGGVFTIPDTSNTQIFSLGSTMNVSWSTHYSSINLYLIFNAEYNKPKTLLFGSTRTYYEWEVDDNGNNTRPFNFRIVNAGGTSEDLIGGGFYTGQFWIKRDAVDTTTSTISAAAATTSSVQETTTSAKDTTSSVEDTTSPVKDTTSSAEETTSSDTETTETSEVVSTSSRSSSSAASTSMLSTPTAATQSSMPSSTEIESLDDPVQTSVDTPDEKSDDQPNITAIGIGVGIGAGLLVAVLVIAIWFFCRRHRRKKNEVGQPHLATPATFDSKNPRQFHQGWALGPQEMSGTHGIYEFATATKSPVEAASVPVPAWELQGSVVQGRT